MKTGALQDPAATAGQQRRQNLRLGLILASVAVAFFVGFMLKAAYFGL